MRKIIINTNVLAYKASLVVMEKIYSYNSDYIIDIEINLGSKIDDIISETDEDIILINLIGGNFRENTSQHEAIYKSIKYNQLSDHDKPKIFIINIFNNNVKWYDISNDYPELKDIWFDNANTVRDKKIGNSEKELPDTIPYMPKLNKNSKDELYKHSIKKIIDLRTEYVDSYPGTTRDSYDK